MTKKKEHYWYYCEHCQAPTVICGTCGNNGCNGGSNCNDCEEAYLMSLDISQCPKEILEKEDFDYKVNKMDLTDLLNFEKSNVLTEFQKNSIEKQKQFLKA